MKDVGIFLGLAKNIGIFLGVVIFTSLNQQKHKCGIFLGMLKISSDFFG